MMTIDRDFRITFVNKSLVELIRTHIDEFHKRWPALDVDNLIGTCIDIFHEDPNRQRQMLSSPDRLPVDGEASVGDSRFAVRVVGIFDRDGNYVGNCAEWQDITVSSTNSCVIEAIGRNQAVIEFAMDGTILSVNDNFLSAFRCTEADVIGHSHAELCPREHHQDGTYEAHWRRLRAGENLQGTFYRVDRTGREVILQASYNPVVDRSGRPYKVVKIASDITELETGIRERTRTLDAIGRYQAVFQLRPDGRISEVNENFLKVTGHNADAVIDRPHAILVDEATRSDPSYAAFLNALANGEPQIGTYRYVTAAGGEIHLQVMYSPVKNEDGTLARIVACASDVTEAERQRLDRDAERREKEAAQSRVVEALTAGLDSLAAGELTVKLDTPFSQEYEQLRVNFNAAIGKLCEAMHEVVMKAQGIRGSAAQISQSADDLAKRTESQAGSLEETAAAIEQLTSSVKSAAERAEVAETSTKKAQTDAESGEAVVRDTIDAMTEIDRSSEQISEIIGVIDDIAFQTNLLALNAGVEAARAGDAGRGFAVVASEVRALAQRCSDAAKEIKELISESGEHVKRGVDLVGRTGAALEEINKSVVEISGLVSGISTSTREQSLGLSDINTAVSQLDEVTQQNAAMVEESTAASHELTTDAEELAALIARFQIDAEDDDARWRDAEQKGPARVQRRTARRKATTAAATAPADDPEDDGWEDF